jgi:DNA (cytosine-5)-methyltransferase 1
MAIIGVDFFCGAGGATKGFQDAGIRVLRGIDSDPTCKETYEKNCFPSRFLMRDANDLKFEEVLDGISVNREDRLLFIACAPCQPFSRLSSDPKHDDRTDLMNVFSRFVEHFSPDFVFAENVPGIANAKKGRIRKKDLLNEFVERLDSRGYEYEARTVDAKFYGVPQKRARYIILSSLFGTVPFPVATHGNDKLPLVTVQDAISKYPPVSAGEENKSFHNHVARSLSALNLKRIRKTPKDGGSRKDWPEDLWLKCHKKKHSGHSDVYGRMSWRKPAPTLTCKCNSISNGRFGHPDQYRAISLREAAALQTFPDDFIFYGNQTDIARHIGNAIPPLIAKVFGEAIVNFERSLHQSTPKRANS